MLSAEEVFAIAVMQRWHACMQVWDTNALVVATSFTLPVRVYALGMSHVAAVHCLIAVGGGDPQVRALPVVQLLICPATSNVRTTHAGHDCSTAMQGLAYDIRPAACQEAGEEDSDARGEQAKGPLSSRRAAQVKLCDPASGAFTHSLVGHREAVWALHWSRASEWHLFTGACDGQVPPLTQHPSPAPAARQLAGMLQRGGKCATQ
jgi:hypothetical protein